MEDAILFLIFLILFVLSYYLCSKDYLKINSYELNTVEVGRLVKFCGHIVTIKDYNTVCYIKLKDQYGYISAVDFYNCPKDKEFICIIGRKSIYKGRPQISIIRYAGH